MDDKYIKLKAVLQYQFLYIVLILGLVRGDGQCRHVTGFIRTNGIRADEKQCVSNITCEQYEGKINISWKQPVKSNPIDFYIGLTNVSIGNYDGYAAVIKSKNTLMVYSESTTPVLELRKDYNVTISVRYSEKGNKAFQIDKECTKVHISNRTTKQRNVTLRKSAGTMKTTSRTKTTTSTENLDRQKTTKRSKNNSGKTFHRHTETTKSTGQIERDQTSVRLDIGTQGTGKSEKQYLVIGLCVVGSIVSIIVVIMIVICMKRRKQNKQGTQNESKQQNVSESNRFEEEDTYNHLSHDHHVLNNERGRQRNYLTNDDAEEEDTYNHMSLRYHDNKGTTEAALQDTYSHITLAKEDSAKRKQISTQSAGNYDDISFKDEGEKEQGDKGRSEGGQSGSNPDKSNTAVPVDVHEVINADVPSTTENEATASLSRTEGPKGDLYTEVAIKN